ERRGGLHNSGLVLLDRSSRERADAARREASLQARALDCGGDRRGRRAFPASDPADDHGFTQTHWVTGSAGCHATIVPSGFARSTDRRTSSPPCAAWRAIRIASVSSVTALT